MAPARFRPRTGARASPLAGLAVTGSGRPRDRTRPAPLAVAVNVTVYRTGDTSFLDRLPCGTSVALARPCVSSPARSLRTRPSSGWRRRRLGISTSSSRRISWWTWPDGSATATAGAPVEPVVGSRLVDSRTASWWGPSVADRRQPDRGIIETACGRADPERRRSSPLNVVATDAAGPGTSPTYPWTAGLLGDVVGLLYLARRGNATATSAHGADRRQREDLCLLLRLARTSSSIRLACLRAPGVVRADDIERLRLDPPFRPDIDDYSIRAAPASSTPSARTLTACRAPAEPERCDRPAHAVTPVSVAVNQAVVVTAAASRLVRRLPPASRASPWSVTRPVPPGYYLTETVSLEAPVRFADHLDTNGVPVLTDGRRRARRRQQLPDGTSRGCRSPGPTLQHRP